MPQTRLFHYTTQSRLDLIIKTGQILPATAFVPLTERPGVWLSYRQRWEPTASKGIVGPDGTCRTATFEEMVARDRPCRIEVSVEAAPLTWREWSVRSGVHKTDAKKLRKSAELVWSSVTDYRMSFEPIDQRHWIAVEVFADGGWVPADLCLPSR